MTVSSGEARVRDPDAPQRGSIPEDTFAGRLKLVRLHAGDLTIVQAAERCGLLNQSWSNWEGGKIPRDQRDIVDAIAGGLGIDPVWLMWGGPLTPEQSRRQLRRSRNNPGNATYRTRAKFRPAGPRAALHPEAVRRPVLLRNPLGIR
jgi:transcriptional regulator with XRE-family HTH domain